MTSNESCSIEAVTAELKALQAVKFAGDCGPSDEFVQSVQSLLQDIEQPPEISTIGKLAYMASPFQRYKSTLGENNCHVIWKKWREYRLKSTLQSDFRSYCDKQTTLLRETYASVQGNHFIPALLRIALSCTGSYGEWDEQSFEGTSMAYLGRCPGISEELSERQIVQQLQQVKGPSDIQLQRSRLLRRVLRWPRPVGDTQRHPTPALYSFGLTCATAFREHYVDVHEYCGRHDPSEESREDAGVRLREALAGDEDRLGLLDHVMIRRQETTQEDKIRVNALLALVPQMAYLTLSQAKWLVFACLCSGDDIGRDLLHLHLPEVMVQALRSLFMLTEIVTTEGEPFTVRMAAMTRLGRCALEDPEANSHAVTTAFNMALVKLANKLPALDGSYRQAWLNADEVACLLDTICEMQATACLRDVRRLYQMTGGRVVNHRRALFSRGGTGLAAFLESMGVVDAADENSAGTGKVTLPPPPPKMPVLSEEAKKEQEEKRRRAVERIQLLSARSEGAASRGVSCVFCGVAKPSNEMKRCSRCAAAHYCDEKCQRSHWKVHKLVCGKT